MKRHYLTACIVIALLGAATPSLANESMIYGGDWCQPVDSTETGFTMYGTLTSTSSSNRRVLCPVLRQIEGNTTAPVSAEIEGWAPSGGSVSCVLSTRNQWGQVVDSISGYINGPGDGVISLGDPGDGDTDGFYDLRCILYGANSKIYNYEVVEPCSNCTAVDSERVLPGHVCRASIQSDQDDVSYFSTGAAYNEGASQTFECPWLKDNRSDDDGILTMSVWVEEPANTALSCIAYAYDHDGDFWDSATFDAPTGHMEIGVYPGPDSLAGGFYFVRCIVPVGGRIYSLLGTEDGGGTP